jgi:hypothetical protein
MRPLRFALAAVALGPVTLAAQQVTDDGRAIGWEGTIAKGALLRTDNVNGEVRIVAGLHDRVVVKGTRSVRRGDPQLLRVETRRRGDGGLVLCVVQPGQRCGEQGIEGRSDDRRMRDSEVRIDLVVEVPAGSPIHAETVNGGVRVFGATASVKAESVNGDVVIEGGDGEIEAETVNGSITMRPAGATRAGTWSAEAVNGSVTVELPAGAGADVDIETVNGSVRTDLPITVRGRMERGQLRGRVGDGGRALKVETVNGSITLRQRS